MSRTGRNLGPVRVGEETTAVEMGAGVDAVVVAVHVVGRRRASLVEECVLSVGEIVIAVNEVGADVDESILLLVDSGVSVDASVIAVATSVSRVDERGFPVPECRPRARECGALV